MLTPIKNASLLERSGMATPARAAFLVVVDSLNALYQAFEFAEHHDLPYLVLGEGSNTVFARDYSGLVIINKIRGIQLIAERGDAVTVDVSAGENWHDFVQYSLQQGWYGLENLALIPGSMGAAPIQNIGAYGVEVESCIESVEYLHKQSKALLRLPKLDCGFAYRDSVFKQELRESAMITSVRLRLSKQPSVNLEYHALRNLLQGNAVTPQQVFDAVCEVRSQKLPLPEQLPNCGSFFKNPVISNSDFIDLQSLHPDIVGFRTDNGVKLAAAWLIQQGGWKQKPHHGVCVHQSQALVITNPNKASGKEVVSYAKAIQRDVLHRYDVSLEIEPRIY